MKYRRLFFGLIVLGLTACFHDGRVTEVVDGDTFRLANGETVRLLGINTPEMSEPGGDIARDMAVQLLLGKKVRLKRDQSDRDDYHRLLRYVYLKGRCINEELVRLGYAETRFYPPDTLHKKDFEEAEKMALRGRRGLWAFNVFQAPDTTALLTSGNQSKAFTTEVVSWRDAGRYYGQTRTVEGRIAAAHNTGKVCFLNFDKNWKESFTIVIFASDFNKFKHSPEVMFLNRTVRVTGLIKEYKGKPEIVVKNPKQIEIVK